MTHAKLLLLVRRVRANLDRIENQSQRKNAKGLAQALLDFDVLVHEFCGEEGDHASARLEQLRKECDHEMIEQSAGVYNEDVCRKCGKSEWF